jgi:hypothetical protein
VNKGNTVKLVLHFLASAGVACVATFLQTASMGDAPFSKRSCMQGLVTTAVVFAALLKQSPLAKPPVPTP